MALKVLNEGDASEQTVLALKSGNVSSYTGPESNKMVTKKKYNKQSNTEIIDT